MRILVLTQYFWPENFRSNDLVASFLAQGHEVEVVTGLPNYPEGAFYSEYGFFSRHPHPVPENLKGVRIHRVWVVPRGRRKGVQLVLNYFSFILSATFYLLFCLPRKFDCTFVYAVSPLLQAIPGVFLKIFKRVPLVIWVQDLWPETLSAVGVVKSGQIIQLVGSVVKWIYRRTDLILIQSEAFREKVALWGAKREKTKYLPNWADEFPEEKLVVADDLPKESFKIIFAGNLGKAQGLEVILDAAELTKHDTDLKWVLLGDGFERQNIESEVKRRDLTGCVQLLGRRPPETMSSYFSQAGALLVTLRDDLIFAMVIPSKVQAYLAAGKPILGALNGEGARLIEEEKVGYASSALDGQTLAENALKLKSLSEAERHLMGVRGRAVYKREFQRESLMRKLEQWMKEVAP